MRGGRDEEEDGGGGEDQKWVWMVVQGAGWSGVVPRDERRRVIGPVQLQPAAYMTRFMAYNAIIHGAQGLLYFGMNVGLHPDQAPYGWDWGYWRGAVAPVLAELRSPELAGALAHAGLPHEAEHEQGRGQEQRQGQRQEQRQEQRQGQGNGQMRSRSGVETRTLTAPDGGRVVLAARRERERGTALEVMEAVPLSGGAGRVEVCFEGRERERVDAGDEADGAIRDRFLPWQVHVYREGAYTERRAGSADGAAGGAVGAGEDAGD